MEEEKKEISFEENEFIKWCEANELETDAGKLGEIGVAVETLKRRFCRAVAKKRLTVEGDKLIYVISEKSSSGFAGEKLELVPPCGSAFIKNSDDAAVRSMEILSAMTGKDVGYFRKLSAVDFNFLSGVAVAFLAL